MGIYIKLPNELKPLSNDVTKADVEQALGYTPADQESVDSIHDAESKEYYVTDKDGNIIFKIDAEGVHTTEVELGDTSEVKVKVKEHINNEVSHVTQEDRDRWDDNTAASSEAVSQHVKNTGIHITAEERTSWNSKSSLPNIVDDKSGEYNITDANGNIIFKVDKDGIHSTELTIPGGKLSELIKAASTALSKEITRATKAEEVLADKVDEVESIAKGAGQARSFGDYATMIEALNALPNGTYNVGQNILIVTLEVPDLWVSSISATSTAYTYVDDATFTTALKENGSVQVGYYVLSALETQKVDLTDYAKNSDLTKHTGNTSNPHGVTAKQLGLGNVNNTSDADKPVSTAQQTALDNLKKTMSEQIVSESKEWHIVDEAGNIVATIDADGVHSTAFYANGEDVVQKITNIINGTTTVAKATTAGSATKATQDGDGNVIADTYEKKEYTEGLEYTLYSDGTYYSVSSIGTATDVDIVIPSEYKGLPVTGIKLNAFENESIKSVVIPDSVTGIQAYAFNGCTNLESVTLGKGLQSIGGYAFKGCSSLKSIAIPDGCTIIYAEAFKDCSALEIITIPASVTYINTDAFSGCGNLTIYAEATTIPEGWTDSNIDDLPVKLGWGVTAPNVFKSAHAITADKASSATALDLNWHVSLNSSQITSSVIDVTFTVGNLYLIAAEYKYPNDTYNSIDTMVLYMGAGGNKIYSTQSYKGAGCYYSNGKLYFMKPETAENTNPYSIYIRKI